MKSLIKHLFISIFCSCYLLASACSDDNNATTQLCGDGICQTTENATTCPQDCDAVVTTCGDMMCEGEENSTSCPEDCGAVSVFCGDGFCLGAEDTETCPQDCGTCIEGCDGNKVLYCNMDGTQASVKCPTEFGSTCLIDGNGQLGCSCGNLPDGDATCSTSDKFDLAVCLGEFSQLYECAPGSICDTEAGVTSCYCDNQDDGICPDPACIDDSDCSTCVPDCSGKMCGDNGCGSTCGMCRQGTSCDTTTGMCEASCTPDCSGRTCGSDGCGGSCGSCSMDETCSTAGTCEASQSGECACEFSDPNPNDPLDRRYFLCFDEGCLSGNKKRCLWDSKAQEGECVQECGASDYGKQGSCAAQHICDRKASYNISNPQDDVFAYYCASL